jgi:hypothetical protein
LIFTVFAARPGWIIAVAVFLIEQPLGRLGTRNFSLRSTAGMTSLAVDLSLRAATVVERPRWISPGGQRRMTARTPGSNGAR